MNRSLCLKKNMYVCMHVGGMAQSNAKWTLGDDLLLVEHVKRMGHKWTAISRLYVSPKKRGVCRKRWKKLEESVLRADVELEAIVTLRNRFSRAADDDDELGAVW